MRKQRLMAISMAGLLTMGGLTACEEPQWDKPEYIKKKLAEEGASINATTLALNKVGELDTEAQKKLIPELVKVYLQKDANQKKAMDILIQLRDAAAKDAYLEEVKTDATKYASAAAEALGETKVKESIPELIKFFEGGASNDAKQGIMRGWTYIPDPQMVPVLSKVLAGDPDNTPMPLMSYACDILGDIALKSPQSIDAATTSTLVRGIFLSNKLGQNVANECGIAVQNVGKGAHGDLLKLYKEEHQGVQKLLLAYSVADPSLFPPNASTARATVRLATGRVAAAAPLFLETISGEIKVPDALKGKARGGWIVTFAQTMPELMQGLGILKHKPAKDILVKIMRGKKDEDFRTFMSKDDPNLQVVVRGQASTSLNKLGDRSAAPDMLASATKDLIAKQEEVAKYFEKQKKPMGAVGRYSFNIVVMQNYSALAGADGLAAFDKAMAKVSPAPLKAELMKSRPALVMGKECLSKADDKAKGACFAGKLGDADELVRMKAAYEITRLDPAVAAPIVAKNISTKKYDVREILTLGAYNAPSKAALAAVEKILAGPEPGGKDMAGKLDRLRLKYLRGYLTHNAK